MNVKVKHQVPKNLEVLIEVLSSHKDPAEGSIWEKHDEVGGVNLVMFHFAAACMSDTGLCNLLCRGALYILYLFTRCIVCKALCGCVKCVFLHLPMLTTLEGMWVISY